MDKYGLGTIVMSPNDSIGVIIEVEADEFELDTLYKVKWTHSPKGLDLTKTYRYNGYQLRRTFKVVGHE